MSEANDRIVISRDGGWQVGDLVSSIGGGGGTGNAVIITDIDTSNLSAGDPVYIDGSGDPQLASCNAAATAEVVGIVGSTANTVIVMGQVEGFVGLTPGARYYLGEEIVTITPPTTDQYFVTKMAIALSSTKLLLDIDEICQL